MSRRLPPPGLVAAAEQDYHTVSDRLTDLTNAVDGLLAGGYTDFEAVADVWLTLRTQSESPQVWLLAAIAVVRLAKDQESTGQDGGPRPGHRPPRTQATAADPGTP